MIVIIALCALSGNRHWNMVKVGFEPFPTFQLFEVRSYATLLASWFGNSIVGASARRLCLTTLQRLADLLCIQPMGKPTSRNSASLSRRHLPTAVLVRPCDQFCLLMFFSAVMKTVVDLPHTTFADRTG